MGDLKRFYDAHKQSYNCALQEIKRGRKESHWMWFIFPQIKGLGKSSTAQYYAITDMEEAKEFLEDEYLGGNLREISKALLEIETDNPYNIFGGIDAVKLCSSMTLFYYAGKDSKENEVFFEVLKKYFKGRLDGRTLEKIE